MYNDDDITKQNSYLNRKSFCNPKLNQMENGVECPFGRSVQTYIRIRMSRPKSHKLSHKLIQIRVYIFIFDFYKNSFVAKIMMKGKKKTNH